MSAIVNNLRTINTSFLICHKLWQITIQLVKGKRIPNISLGQTTDVGHSRTKVSTQICEESDIPFLSRILLTNVLAEVPIEFDQRRIDGDRRLDLRCTIPALEVGNPRGVGLRLSAALHKSRALLSRFLLHVSPSSNSIFVSAAGEMPMPALIRSPPNGRLCRDQRGG